MTTRELSTIHEKAVAKALGGRRTANSGATPFKKGDVIVGEVLIECKTKAKETNKFSISKEWLDTIQMERKQMQLVAGFLAISFNCGKDSYYVIDEKSMQVLLDTINGLL